MDKEERDFQTLLKGKEYEKAGDIDNAIKMYEKLVKSKFDGSFPYFLTTVYLLFIANVETIFQKSEYYSVL